MLSEPIIVDVKLFLLADSGKNRHTQLSDIPAK